MSTFFVYPEKFRFYMMYKIILCAWFIIDSLISQTIIGPGLTKDALFTYLSTNYKTSSTLGYSQARDIMYSIIDIQENNVLSGIYTGYSIVLDLTQDPSTNAYEQDINCEHSWPQSMGASSEPQKSDLHHLYPCKANVNSARGNRPFGDINDEDTDKWFRLDYDQTSIPNQNIDEYSEADYDADRFEPREHIKGDIARGMFYFFTIYNNAANHNFFEEQKDFLFIWHKQDPVNDTELSRTFSIASYQDDIVNPFVVDSTLVKRIWYFSCYENVTSQELLEHITGYDNYEPTIDINSDSKINLMDLIYIMDRESGDTAYFICN